MSINATLFGQMITFALFAWFTMKFVWPILEQTLADRQQKISEGLASAEKGRQLLSTAESQAERALSQARERCANIIASANKQANLILEDAKAEAVKERDAIIASGHTHVQQAYQLARTELQKEMGDLIISGAEKILAREIKPEDHQALISELVSNG